MDVEGCPLPDDRRYDVENDVWAAPGPGPGIVTIGMMAHLAWFAGKLTVVTYRPLEGSQPVGRSIATAESVRYVGPVRLPIAGTVVATSVAVVAKPRLVNDAPYSDGWLARLKPDDPTALDRLPLAADVAGTVRRKVREMRIHCLPALPDLEMFEIGIECAAILAVLDDELRRRPVGEVVHLVTDDPTSPIEMVRWSDRSGYPVLASWPEANLRHFLVRKTADPRPLRRVVPVG